MTSLSTARYNLIACLYEEPPHVLSAQEHSLFLFKTPPIVPNIFSKVNCESFLYRRPDAKGPRSDERHFLRDC